MKAATTLHNIKHYLLYTSGKSTAIMALAAVQHHLIWEFLR